MPSSLSLLSLNCEDHRHIDLIVPFLRAGKFDVVCLQEVFAQDVPALTEAAGMELQFFPMVNVTLPNRFGIAPLGLWGIAMGARNAVLDVTATVYAGDPEQVPTFVDGNPNSVRRILLSADVEHDGQQFRIATTHFTWTPDGQPTDEQRQDFVKLQTALAALGEVVLCGDFNAPRGGEIFSQLARAYADNIPADITSTLDPILHRAKGVSIVVDGLFSSPSFTVSDVNVVTGVSDHCALTANVSK